MLVLLSPAKRLDFETPLPKTGVKTSEPSLLSHTSVLVKRAKLLKPQDLVRLMGISQGLAQLNVERFQAFQAKPGKAAKAAIYAFRGDTYQGFDVDSLDPQSLSFAQDHVRILSGLYGLLRPFDVIQPYRLEMGTKLATDRGKNLYDFWGGSITQAINDATRTKSEPVLNLASNEYFSSVKVEQLKGRLCSCVFKERKKGVAKVVSFSAKRARGMMARFVCLNRVKKLEELEGFALGGYEFQPQLSSDTVKEFHREA